jgi:hypothetical protein
MAAKRRKHHAGLTFVEIMIATVVLLLAVMGTSAFRYSAALSARQADLQATAARTALLLCESWRGASDPCTFDPRNQPDEGIFDESVFAIRETYASIQVPEGFTVLGTYRIAVNGVHYYTVLSWKDVSDGLRALNVVVAWDTRGSGSDNYWYPDRSSKSFRLTTYVTG